MTKEISAEYQVNGARCLLNLGESITTDHISPAGNMSRKSPAGRYLEARGVAPVDLTVTEQEEETMKSWQKELSPILD